jgi:hypothetical protein
MYKSNANGSYMLTAASLAIRNISNSEDYCEKINRAMVDFPELQYNRYNRSYPVTLVHSGAKEFIANSKAEYESFLLSKQGNLIWRGQQDLQSLASLFNVTVSV